MEVVLQRSGEIEGLKCSREDSRVLVPMDGEEELGVMEFDLRSKGPSRTLSPERVSFTNYFGMTKRHNVCNVVSNLHL